MTNRLSLPPLPPAAVLDLPGFDARWLVAEFVAELKGRGWRVGERDLLVFDRLSDYDAAVGAASGAARGSRLEDVPAVTMCGADQLLEWDRLTKGRGVILPPRASDLWRWWGPQRLYTDLALGVSDVPVRRAVVGLNWVLVEGPDGCGLAFAPRSPGGCRALPAAGRLAGSSLRGLAGGASSLDQLETALGIAAINAHYNRFDVAGEDANGLDEICAVTGPAVAVGRFPGLVERRPDISVIEYTPHAGEFPEEAAPWLFPAAAVILLTSSALVNHSLPNLLGVPTAARRVLLGPGTPLSERLFTYGLDVLAGIAVTDPEGAARVVAEGGAVKALKPFTRTATLRRPATV